jgi:hypothetical protein
VRDHTGVYARHVYSSSLGFSLSSHRQSYIGLVFSSRFIDLIINKSLELIIIVTGGRDVSTSGFHLERES